MKKTFSSNIKVILNLFKEKYDDQYEQGISTLGNNEVQLNIGSKFTDISQHQVFQKREKLVHSPENKEILNSQSQNIEDLQVNNTENFKTKINDLLKQTEHIIFKFDNVMTCSDDEMENLNLIKDHAEKLFKVPKNLVFFSFFKSNLILNYSLDEIKYRKELEEEFSKSIGIFPNIISKILSENSMHFQDPVLRPKIRIYGVSINKIYDLLCPETKIFDNPKDITKLSISTNKDMIDYLVTVRDNIILKKQHHYNYICYEIEVKNEKMKSKICYIEFISPFEKTLDKIDKDKPTKNLESSIEIFINPLKLIYAIFTNSKWDQGLLEKDKILDILKYLWKPNTEFCFCANLRPISPLYYQNLLVLQFINKIYEKKDTFDTIFISILLQISHMISSRKIKYSKGAHQNLQHPNEEIQTKLDQTAKENKILKEEILRLKRSYEEVNIQKVKIEKELGQLKKDTTIYLEKIRHQYQSEINDLKSKIENKSIMSLKPYKRDWNIFHLPTINFQPIERENEFSTKQLDFKNDLAKKYNSINFAMQFSTDFFKYFENEIDENRVKLNSIQNLSSQTIEFMKKKCKILEGQNKFLLNINSLLLEKCNNSKI